MKLRNFLKADIMRKNSEKGISLIITFFVLVIILAVVLSISIILYSEIKIIRNMGYSVVAYYAAESGVEKVLYYDRKVIPDGALRGICNICTACPDSQGPLYCQFCLLTSPHGTECSSVNCLDCEVDFSTNFDDASGKTYDVKAIVSPNQSDNSSDFNVNITGQYRGAKRAIEIFGNQ